MESTATPIRRARVASGKSQEQVARDLDVSVVTFGNWERGTSAPTGENLVRLADYFGVHPRDLLVADAAEARG